MVFFLAFLLIADAKPIDEVTTLVYVRTLLKWILTGAVYFRIRRSNPNLARQTLCCKTICKAVRVHFSHRRRVIFAHHVLIVRVHKANRSRFDNFLGCVIKEPKEARVSLNYQLSCRKQLKYSYAHSFIQFHYHFSKILLVIQIEELFFPVTFVFLTEFQYENALCLNY